MIQSPYHWIRENGRRMDRALRYSLFQRLKVLRYIPCVLHHTALRVIHTFSNTRVLVQLDPQTVTNLTQFERNIHSLGSHVESYYSSIHTYGVHCSWVQLQKLMNLPEVRKVYLDRKVYALLDTATPATGALPVWNQFNRGDGVTIAVVDTGIHPHPDLVRPENRIVAFKDFVKGKTSPYDDNGHGTHCAGDAAGNGFASGGKYQGPAPRAQLAGVKVLNKMGSGNLSDVIAGIQWCIDNKNKYNIRVISLSLGSQNTTSYQDDPVAQIAEKAWNEGITVVAAAGNDGPEAGTISSPGIHPKLITVGASDNQGTIPRNDDKMASFSSRGPTPDGITKPDVVAPGTNITSLRVKGSYIDKMSPDSRVDNHYVTLSGTSMATPIVAGICALILTQHPHWSPDQVKKALTSTAEDLGFPPNDQGWGHVQADRAVTE